MNNQDHQWPKLYSLVLSTNVVKHEECLRCFQRGCKVTKGQNRCALVHTYMQLHMCGNYTVNVKTYVGVNIHGLNPIKFLQGYCFHGALANSYIALQPHIKYTELICNSMVNCSITYTNIVSQLKEITRTTCRVGSYMVSQLAVQLASYIMTNMQLRSY